MFIALGTGQLSGAGVKYMEFWIWCSVRTGKAGARVSISGKKLSFNRRDFHVGNHCLFKAK